MEHEPERDPGPVLLHHQSISQSITSAQSNVDNVQAQIDALNTGANDYYLYAPTSGVIHMDSPYKEAWC